MAVVVVIRQAGRRLAPSPRPPGILLSQLRGLSDGALRGRAQRDGPLSNGALRDGALRDGALRDGALTEGALRDGALTDGALRDGPLTEGPLREGAPREGALNDEVLSRPLSKYLEHVYHPSRDPARNLVLVGTFLASKPKHFRRLQQFYLDRGFDLLYYKGQVRHVLHPALASTVSLPLADALLSDPLLINRRIHVHAFSVGIFFFGHMLVHMTRNLPQYAHILPRISSVVCDSPATIVKAPIGIAHSLTNNPALRRAATRFFEVYYWLLREAVAQHGTRADAAFAENVPGYSVLMLYSASDVVSRGCAQRFVRKLEDNGNALVFSHAWADALHATLMRSHGDEYFSLLDQFLLKSGYSNTSIDIEYQEQNMRAKGYKF